MRGTRNWSACGRDTIYNFWLKYLPASHLHLARLYSTVLRNPEQLLECTLLIPKVVQPKAGEYRPITIKSNMLKLLSKIVLSKVKSALVESRVISENQGAFGDNTVNFKIEPPKSRSCLMRRSGASTGVSWLQHGLMSRRRSTVSRTHTCWQH